MIILGIQKNVLINGDDDRSSQMKFKVTFGFFVWWHINLRGLSIAKAILVEER